MGEPVHTLEEIEAKRAQLENASAKIKWQLARSITLLFMFAIALICYYQFVFYSPAMKYWQRNLEIKHHEQYLSNYRGSGEQPDAGLLTEYGRLKEEEMPIALPVIGYIVLTSWFFISVLLLPPRIKPRNRLRYLQPMRELLKELSPSFSETQVRILREKLSATIPLADRLKKVYPYVVILLLGIYCCFTAYLFSIAASDFLQRGFNPLFHLLMLNKFGVLLVMTVCLLKTVKFKTKREARLDILAWIANEPVKELN